MKALIIGLGGIGQRHARNLRAILGDRVEIIAYRVRRLPHVITPLLRSDPTKNVEEELGIRAFSSLAEALAPGPDIAFLCNPSSMHVRIASACIEAGCDLFIEKPLSDSLEGIDALIKAAEQKGRIAMVGYQLRFHPCLREFASIIGRGCLGHLLSVRATIGEYLPNWHPYEDYRQMYAARADLGGGVVLSQIHEFDYLFSLFGVPSKMYAIGGHWSHLEIDVEDVSSVLMEASIDGRPLPIHLHQDYLQVPPTRQCEAIGDRGKAVLDFPSRTVTLFDSKNAAPTISSFPDLDRNQLFVDELTHFLECVEKRTRPIVDLHDGLQSLRMALAAKQSMSTGMPVNLGVGNAEFTSV